MKQLKHYSRPFLALVFLGIGLGCTSEGLVSPSVLGIENSGDTTKPQLPSGSTTPTDSTTTDVSGLYSGPEELAKYVAKFVDDGKAQGIDVSSEMVGPLLQVRIASLDSYGASVIGLCESSASLRRVTFDPDFWNSVSETQRELLAHHEFGHCVLYRPHRTAILDSGAYASIMYPIIMKSSTYTSNYDYYQNELFQYSAATSIPEDYDPNQILIHVCDENELGLPHEEGHRE